MNEQRKPIGLLAGAGRFPIAFAEKARSVGIPVSCVGLAGQADPVLADVCWRFHWAGIGKLSRQIRLFRRDAVERIVMAGKIQKADVLYRPWRMLYLMPDFRTLKTWYSLDRSDNKDDTLILAFIREFEKDGLHFASALDLCPELLVKPDVLTKRRPNSTEEGDIAFGWDLARKMGELDIGQSVVVKELNVLAVEAVEGTDRAILRAGELCRRGGFVVVKVAKPNQDMRFDVPTIGCTTIETIHKAKGRVLAIEAGKTIVLDQPQTVALADRLGICIVALNRP